MAAGNNVNAYKQPFWSWNSPLPYLFGGLGLMFALIVIALLILACSYRRRTSSGGGAADDEVKSVKPIRSLAPVPMAPQIVVIMAGDENPTRLAVPANSSSSQPNLCANCNAGNHHSAAVDDGDVADEEAPPAMQMV